MSMWLTNFNTLNLDLKQPKTNTKMHTKSTSENANIHKSKSPKYSYLRLLGSLKNSLSTITQKITDGI